MDNMPLSEGRTVTLVRPNNLPLSTTFLEFPNRSLKAHEGHRRQRQKGRIDRALVNMSNGQAYDER